MTEAFPLRGRDVVCISSIDWDFLWQGHQEIISRFAAAGNRVTFVENTGTRNVRLGDWRRLLARLRKWSQSRPRSAAWSAGVDVVSPLLVPFPRWRTARSVNERLLIPALARRIRARCEDDPILFTFLPTPNALRIISELRGPRSVVVYYCIADFRELSDLGELIELSEQELVATADLVFVQSEQFAERFRSLNPSVYSFQFGVRLEAFQSAEPTGGSELARMPRPIIGYSGGLHRHVDFVLLATLAAAIPGSVVLVGPPQTDVTMLRHTPNIHLLGPRSFDALPGLVAEFDVALVPYVRTPYTDTVFPTKLFEYLAAGRPVVCTDLPEVRRLDLPEWAVRIASTHDDFIAAVRSALDSERPGLAQARQRLARRRDWGPIVQEMARLIAAS